ncbi:hypothetical protein ABT248_32505 [Streptomyces sp. NPDC000971]
MTVPPEMEKPKDAADLYYAYGEDVVEARPILTGDVFTDVTITEVDGVKRQVTVMILDHPCSLRTDGVNLVDRLTVAEVVPAAGAHWKGSFDCMFLPMPFPQSQSKSDLRAARFDKCHHISPAQLDAGTRITCLSHFGINLMLQRRVKNFSRVLVPTFEFQKANVGVYEEADLIEEWCTERENTIKINEAVAECVGWLQEADGDGRLRQHRLHESQYRSTVRKEMRARLKELKQ